MYLYQSLRDIEVYFDKPKRCFKLYDMAMFECKKKKKKNAKRKGKKIFLVLVLCNAWRLVHSSIAKMSSGVRSVIAIMLANHDAQ